MSESIRSALALKNIRSRFDRLRKPAGEGINRFEHRVYSQHREDGIIDKIISLAGIKEKSCIEFGFGPTQANCLNLVIHKRFTGLFMDGKGENVAKLQNHFELSNNKSVARQVFLTAENINDQFESNGFTGCIGVLSIDIDGNDYWLWDAISNVDPQLVVIEYNASFGPEKAITVPYDPEFVRYEKHDSGLYHGASLRAFTILAMKKGYGLIGCDSSGVNAFFLKQELINPELPAVDPLACFFNHRGRTKYKAISPALQWNLVSEMPYVDLDV